MEELETRRITSKGQITIPLALRETLGFSVGDRISFVKTDDGDVLLRKSVLPETLFGLMDKFSDQTKSVSLGEMDEAISKNARKRHAL